MRPAPSQWPATARITGTAVVREGMQVMVMRVADLATSNAVVEELLETISQAQIEEAVASHLIVEIRFIDTEKGDHLYVQ